MTITPILTILPALFVIVHKVGCYPNGVGVDDACSDLTPRHGSATTQTSDSPYTITFSPTTYSGSGTVSVTISGSSFKGFMIQARNASSCGNTQIGSFTVVTNTITACSNRALVHSNPNSKNSIIFTWNAPSAPAGHIVFRAAVVQSEYVFWTTVQSGVLQDSTLPAITSATQCTSSGTGQTGSFTKDSGCGSSKGCFSLCSGTSCTFSVSWQTTGSTVTYTLKTAYKSSSGFYIALGFSNDNQMGSDSVMGCATDSTNFALFTAENTGKSTPTMFSDPAVTMSNRDYTDGVLTCTITRPVSGAGKRADVSKSWTLFFVFTSASLSGGSVSSLSYHGGNYFISERAVTSTDYVDIGPLEKDDVLVKAHGCLMVLAWVFFASIGVVVARYYKPVLTGTLFSQKVWFQVHRFSMVLVLCVTAIAFIIIFVKEKEWSYVEGEASYLQGHPIMGVIVMILTILNPVMAMFRPHPGTPKRPIFNWAHSLVGMAAHILGVITIFFGIQLQGATTPYYATYIMGAYVAWQLFIKLVLEIITRFNICKSDLDKDSYEMNTVGNAGPKKQSEENEKKKALVKKVIFVIHCVVISCLSAAIIAVIGVGYGGGDDD